MYVSIKDCFGRNFFICELLDLQVRISKTKITNVSTLSKIRGSFIVNTLILPAFSVNGN